MSGIFIMHGEDSREWAQETQEQLTGRGYTCFDREDRIILGETVFELISSCTRECGVCLVALTTACLEDVRYMCGVDMALFSHIARICTTVVVKVESCRVPDALHSTCVLDATEPGYFAYLLEKIAKGLERSQSETVKTDKDTFESNEFHLTEHSNSLPADFISRDSDVQSILNRLFLGGSSAVGIVEGHQPTSDAKVKEMRRGKTSRESLGIWGIGGLGKTVLARMVYTEAKMKYHMHTAWVVFGQEPYLVDIFEDLHYQLVGKPHRFCNKETAQRWLKSWSQTKRVFIVLDDVWNPDHAEFFNVLGLRGRYLITTRDQRVLLQINSDVHELGHLQRHDSRRLLLKVANTSEVLIASNELDKTVSEILSILSDIPLAIATLGASFRVVESESFQKTIWEDALSDLREGGDSTLEKLDKAFDLSFQALSPDLRSLFIHMALFPEDVEISSKVVSKVLSSKVGFCTFSKEKVHREVRQGLRQLKERSLLQFSREAEGVTYYLIHDHLLRFAKQKVCSAEPNGLQALHLSLFEAYIKHHRDENKMQVSSSDEEEEEEEEEEREKQLLNWKETSDLPWWEIEDDGYFYNHVAFHLTRAGLSSVFKALLLQYQWLKAKVKHTCVPGLLADFDAFVKMNKVTKPIKLLHGALLLNADAICQDHNLLGPHLVGSLRAVKNLDIEKFICETESCLQSYGIPIFVPRAQCLTQPGQVLKKIFCHSLGAAILSATVRQSGEEFLTGSSPEAGSVRLGQMTTGESFCLGDRSSSHSSLVTCLALDPYDKFVISGSCDSSVKLWPLPDKIGSMTKGKVTTIGHHKEDVYCVAVTRDGHHAVSGSLDETIKIWNLETCECTSTLNAGAVIRGVCVTENDSLIISCGADSSVMKWNLKTGDLMKHVRAGTGDMVHGITISSDESSLALACSDKTVRILRLSTLEEDGVPFKGHVGDVICCCFSLDQKLLFSGDDEGLMIVWCVHTRVVLQEIFAHSSAVRTIMLTPDQQTIFTSSTDDCIKLWRNYHWKSTRRPLQGKDPGSVHRDAVTHLAISPSGRLAASASRDKTIRIWDVATSKLIVSLTGHEDCINTVEFLPLQHSGHHEGFDQSEGNLESAVVSGSKDGQLIVWNWQKRSYFILGCHPHSVKCLCVSENGSFVFSGSVDSFILMWDPWKKFLVCKLSCGDRAGIHHLSLKLMSDGRRLSAGQRGSIVAWDIEPIVKEYQGYELAGETPSDTHQSGVLEMIVLPSDVLFEPEPVPLPVSALPKSEIFILANSPSNNLRVCRSKVKRENKLRAGHQKGDTITALHISDDETMIFSGSLNGSVRISWRVGCKDTRPIALCSPWQDTSKACAVTAITMLCAGRIVLAGCQNGEIWMWNLRHNGRTSDENTTRDSPKPFQIGVLDSAVSNLRHFGENMVVSSSKSKVNPVIHLWDLSYFVDCTQDENPTTGPGVPSAHLLKRHSGSILDVLVVDKSRLVSSSEDGKLLMWTISHHPGSRVEVDCSTLFTSDLHSVRCLAVTPCKQIILCATCQNYIETWAIEELECKSRLSVKFNIKKLVVLSDSQRFMCLYDDLSIEVRCLKSGDSLTEFQAFQSALGHFCTLFEHTAVSDSVYCSVKVWDTNTSQVKCHIGAESSAAVSAASPLHCPEPEGKSPSIHKHSRRISALDWLGMSHVVTGSYDCHLKLWHLSGKSADCVCQFVFEHTVTALRSVTSKSIAVGLSDGNVYFLDLLNLDP